MPRPITDQVEAGAFELDAELLEELDESPDVDEDAADEDEELSLDPLPFADDDSFGDESFEPESLDPDSVDPDSFDAESLDGPDEPESDPLRLSLR